MKNTKNVSKSVFTFSSIALSITVMSLSGANAFSAPAAKKKLVRESEINQPSTSAARPSTSRTALSSSYSEAPSSSGHSIAVGIADVGNLTATGWSPSAVFTLNDRNTIQTTLSIPSTSGGLVLGVGAIYRYTVRGDHQQGFHIGGGLGLGVSNTTVLTVSTTATRFNFGPEFGFHFTLLQAIAVSLDAGAIVSVGTGSANFGLAGLGNLISMSFHYYL